MLSAPEPAQRLQNLPPRDRELYFKYVNNPIVETDPPFTDARGSIIPIVDEEMKSSVIISSKRGTVRANHFHHTDWHYCYVFSGEIEYHHRPVGSTKPAAITVVKTGQTFFTPPLIEHAMHFTQDTVFLCLGRNPRDQKSYEMDITRIELFSA